MPDQNGAEQLAERGMVLIGDAAHAIPIVGGERVNITVQVGIDLAEHIAAQGIDDLNWVVSERCEMWRVVVEERDARI